MPLYEYTCEACGARFELIRKFSDPPLESCTVCAGGPVHRLPSSPAIQFKGSGFYITDYAKKETGGRRQEEGGGKEDKTSTEKAQDAKSDAAAADRGTDKGADRGTDKGADTGAKADTAAKSTAPAKSDTPAKPSASSPAASGGSKD